MSAENKQSIAYKELQELYLATEIVIYKTFQIHSLHDCTSWIKSYASNLCLANKVPV